MLDTISGPLLTIGFILVVVSSVVISYLMLGTGLGIMALGIVFRALFYLRG